MCTPNIMSIDEVSFQALIMEALELRQSIMALVYHYRDKDQANVVPGTVLDVLEHLANQHVEVHTLHIRNMEARVNREHSEHRKDLLKTLGRYHEVLDAFQDFQERVQDAVQHS